MRSFPGNKGGVCRYDQVKLRVIDVDGHVVSISRYLLVQIHFRRNHFDENIIVAEHGVVETVVQVREFADGVVNFVTACDRDRFRIVFGELDDTVKLVGGAEPEEDIGVTDGFLPGKHAVGIRGSFSHSAEIKIVGDKPCEIAHDKAGKVCDVRIPHCGKEGNDGLKVVFFDCLELSIRETIRLLEAVQVLGNSLHGQSGGVDQQLDEFHGIVTLFAKEC